MPDASQELRRKIDPSRLPSHVAIIMDGNGRWARKRHLPRLMGHHKGARKVREIVEAASSVGIKYLTLYAFSTENWVRPKLEVAGLMRLLKNTLRGEVSNLLKNNVRLETIGDITQLPADIQAEIAKTKRALEKNTGITLVLALNYGGRQDIIQAVNRLIKEGHSIITDALINSRLHTAFMPEPDLLIRTSGENRVSNFLLWQIAYSELHITPVLWPDFQISDFYKAVLDYQSRDRRFGGVS